MEISSQLQASPPVDRRADALGDFRFLPDEVICAILDCLTPRDVASLACVSSVMYIFCNEEPLWMSMCLRNPTVPFQFRGSWKKTTLYSENVPVQYIESCGKPLQFDGFSSVFLYRRFYRCFTSLKQFSFEDGNVERREDLSVEEFDREYDGKKPVLLTGLADAWTARKTWTIDQLSASYGDRAFRISQKSPVKLSMKLKDYVSYTKLQHDEDPLYIFDDDFGEAAPPLLKDYCVPHLFHEDFFDVLDSDSRPPYKWLIIGPERSGASWHIDPALTSAWNTLLCGRKRWALYPPGRVPLGVSVHVNDEDGDVHIETPSSLQWWLDFYPLLAKEDRPIECTQLPGETIFVPSGWWHCVLNLETTVAVTQNFVNSKNFEFVCLDMAPGYCHKGVCRAGLLALDHGTAEIMESNAASVKDILSYPDLTRKEKRIKSLRSQEDVDRSDQEMHDSALGSDNLWGSFSYDINYLAMYLDKEKDHYTSPWSMGNPVGPREIREWLHRLWFRKPEMRELLWKGACLLLNADKWLDRLRAICTFHNLPTAIEDQKLPVGTGSNPVYVMDDYVVKIFAEGGLECSLYCLGTELEFYSVVHKLDSTLKTHIPDIVASGILYSESGSHKIELWEGKEIPVVIRDCDMLSEDCAKLDFPFGLWSRMQFECRKARSSASVSDCTDGSTKVWPYIITRRCNGKLFAQLRDAISKEDVLNLASFLGEQLRNLHLLPYSSSITPISADAEHKVELLLADGIEFSSDESVIPTEWKTFIRTLRWKKEGVVSRLTKWGNPIPKLLIQKVNDYIPDDFCKFLCIDEDENGIRTVGKHFSWIHSDIMDDNIYMEQCFSKSCSYGSDNSSMNGYKNHEGKSWHPSYILDFSDLSVGDSIYDLIPIYLDVFRGDACLFKQFLQNYKLHFFRKVPEHGSLDVREKFQRPSYHAMCYCILHEDNVLGAIFSIWKELRTAKSWEEVELTVWAELNNYELSRSS